MQVRFGYGQGSLIVLAIPLVAMLNATVLSMAASTRCAFFFKSYFLFNFILYLYFFFMIYMKHAWDC